MNVTNHWSDEYCSHYGSFEGLKVSTCILALRVDISPTSPETSKREPRMTRLLPHIHSHHVYSITRHRAFNPSNLEDYASFLSEDDF
jgi:hypothetical protein